MVQRVGGKQPEKPVAVCRITDYRMTEKKLMTVTNPDPKVNFG
jgi:hypothetical protein